MLSMKDLGKVYVRPKPTWKNREKMEIQKIMINLKSMAKEFIVQMQVINWKVAKFVVKKTIKPIFRPFLDSKMLVI